MTFTFPSLSAFRAADPLRARSVEVEFGRRWRTGGVGPSYRAAWLPATGELFVVRLGPLPPGAERVELLAHVPDEGLLTQMLIGWQRACGTFDSIRWLRSRVAHAHPLKRRFGWGLAA